MADVFTAAINDLQGAVADLKVKADTNNALISSFASALTAALAAASSAGATPEQVQAIQAVHDSIVGVTTSLAATATANPLPVSDPVPPVSPNP